MIFRGGLSLVALAVGVLATGCERQAGDDAAQLDRLARLPDCAQVELEKWKRQGTLQDKPDPRLDCALGSSGTRKLTFEVLGSPPMTVKVFDSSGARQQVFQQSWDAVPSFLPFLHDLDEDGRDELVVVTSVGNGWERMKIWRATGEAETFVDAGEADGSTKFWKTADGFVAMCAHTGAGSGVIPLMRFEGNAITTEAMLDVAALGWPDEPNSPHEWVFNGNTKCALTNVDDPKGSRAKQSQTLASLGVDTATARQRFCFEPWVAALYREN